MRLACSRYALIAALPLCVGTALGATVKPSRQTPAPSQTTPPITAAATAQGSPLRQPRWIDVLLLQVWLDRHNFSCGSIDGVFGTKSVAAWEAWQKASIGEHFPPEELAADWLLTSHTVSQEDYAALVDIPPEWEARAKLPTMGFESIAELVAEDYHLSPKALVRLNPTATFPNPPVGTVLVVPNTKDVALEPAARLEIDLDRFTLSAYGATGRQIAHFPVSIARNRSKRPEGTLSIETIVPNPNYLYDPANYGNPPGERKQVIPPGPNNPVGVVWFGLNLPGYGLHGSPHPETIGRAESQGCFRLNNWNALKLLQMIRPHTPLSVH